MPDSLEALGVFLLAVLPGALYTWASEREAGAWSAKASDRVLRFIGVSAIFLALYVVPFRWLWTSYLHVPRTVDGKPSHVNLILEGESYPRGWWAIPLLYVAIPFALGILVGAVVRNRDRYPRLARVLAGPSPAPTAWDDLFSTAPGAILRIKLKKDSGGGWLAGIYGARSHASGYGEEPADLYLEDVVQITQDGVFVDDDGKVKRLGFGALIGRDSIDVIDVFERR